MAIRAELTIYEGTNESNTWELLNKKNFEPMWEIECGENTQQNAHLFKSEKMADFERYNDVTLTYDEILSLTKVTNLISEFYDVNAVAIVNHSSPCGVALAPTIEEAYNKAFDCDPINAFNGTVGLSQKVEANLAEQLNSMAVKLVIAPEYDEKALDILKKNNELKIIKLNTPLKEFKNLAQHDVFVTPFGTLSQEMNRSNLTKSSFNIVTKTRPTKEQIEDTVFAWKVSKYTRSNSAVIVKDFKTCAIAQGFTSCANAIETAMDRACEASKDAILATDNILTTAECIYAAAQGRISLIIQPGGSHNDAKLIEIANKYNIAMIFTGITNIKH